MIKRPPIAGELLQIEYAWLVVEYARMVGKLGVCCMTADEYARCTTVIERSRAMASPAALRSASRAELDIAFSATTGRLLEIGGEPWTPGPD